MAEMKQIDPVMLFMLAWLFSWGAWVTLRIMNCMTREEHQATCTAKDVELNRKLDDIKNTIERNDEVSQQDRHDKNDQLQTITNKLAVIESRLNGPMGQHKV